MKTSFSAFVLKILILLIIHPYNVIIPDARFVNKTGANQFPYTSWETAADSIQKCINICNSGDTIYIANGVYKEQITLRSGLTLIGAGIDSCIIDTRDFTSPVWNIGSINGADSCIIKNIYVKVSNNYYGNGITIFNNYMVCENIKIDNCGDGILLGSANSIIKDCIITNFSYIGILNLSGSYGIPFKPQIINNLLVAKANTTVRAIWDEFTNTILKNNIIFLDGDDSRGYYREYGTSTSYNNLIVGNRFWFGFDNSADSSYVYNNVVIGGSHIGGVSFNIGNIHVVKNNIAFNGVIGFVGTENDNNFKYNESWNNKMGDYFNFTPDSTNLSVDPMFINDTTDFHLQMFSPLIDKGDPSILDKDSSRSDIGLYGGPFGESYQYQDLAPRPPKGLSLSIDTNYVTIKWKKNTEADFNHYNLYRDTVKGFTVNSNNLEASKSDTIYNHAIPIGVKKYFYKLNAVDNQGNISPLSEELGINIVSVNDKPQLISDYHLFQNYPNPFNPSTIISYRIKERGYVKLTIYDIKGEQVAVLVNQHQAAGFYEVKFMGTNTDKGKTFVDRIASGIYLYRLDVKNGNNIPIYSDMKKMILLK